jgi:NTE family protein
MRAVEAESARAAMPNVVEVMTSSLHIMSVRITRSRLAGDPADVVIMPRLGHLGQLDYHRAREAIDEGREATAVLAPQIERLLRG